MNLHTSNFTDLKTVGALHSCNSYEDFAKGHIPGALSIELRPVFSSWLGWLVEPERLLVFVVGEDQDRSDLVRQCLSVGYEHIAGELEGGMTEWRAAGRPEATIKIVSPDALGDNVVDVRQRSEYVAGHLPEAAHIELGSLPEMLDAVPPGPVVMMCGHGERAMTAASLLTARRDVSVLSGGPDDWTKTTGRSLA